jgi:hypothetical protein
MKAQRFERGQALVLIVLSIVAIFGFAALAVDMGRIYAERRRAQSAADAAALAGAYAAANSETDVPDDVLALAQNSGFASALRNGYDNTTKNHVDVTRPDHGSYEECACEYIQVTIDSEIDPIFVQFLGRGASHITTIAVARGRKSSTISSGNAVHALIDNSEGGDGIEVDGNIDFKVKNGNVYSNKNGVKKGASGNVAVTGGKIITADGWTNTDGVTATGGFRSQDPLRIPIPPTPDCAIPAGTSSGGVYTPGTYDKMDFKDKTNTMQPGMYCVKNGITINGNVSVKGDGIFIVLQGGKLTINGTSKVNWKRANNLVDNAGNQWGGMLIYVPPTNTNTVELTGTNGTKFVGTVFAPKALCDYGGTNMTTGSSAQLICHQIRLHGTPDITIDYHEDENYRMPPIVELVE